MGSCMLTCVCVCFVMCTLIRRWPIWSGLPAAGVRLGVENAKLQWLTRFSMLPRRLAPTRRSPLLTASCSSSRIPPPWPRTATTFFVLYVEVTLWCHAYKHYFTKWRQYRPQKNRWTTNHMSSNVTTVIDTSFIMLKQPLKIKQRIKARHFKN